MQGERFQALMRQNNTGDPESTFPQRAVWTCGPQCEKRLPQRNVFTVLNTGDLPRARRQAPGTKHLHIYSTYFRLL